MFQLGFVYRLLGDRLLELCLVETRIDLREQLPFLDILPLNEGHFLEYAIDLSCDGNGTGGLHRAKARQIDRYILARDTRCDHRNRRGGDLGGATSTVAAFEIPERDANTRRH